MFRFIVFSCLLFFAPYVAGESSRADFESKRADLESSYVPIWSELAEQANSKKAFATRNRCYLAILSIVPDHPTALRGLKYRRVDDEWVPPKTKRPAKDSKSKSNEKLAATVDASITEYRDAVLALIERYTEELGPAGRVSAYKRLLSLNPESTTVRELLGETKFDGRWMLVETARSIERHGSLIELAKQSYGALGKLETASPDGFELELGIEWTAGLKSDRVRVFGTSELEELEQILRAAHGMHDLIEGALGKSVPLDRDFTLYSFAEPKDREQMVRHLPGMRSNPNTASIESTGGWLGLDARFANWSVDRPRRVDGSIRGTVSQYLKNGFNISLRHGWASEGIGLYLVEAMVGTRLTWFTKASRYVEEKVAGEKEEFSLESTELNWVEEGRKLLTAKDAPHLGALIGRQVGTMSASDLLHAYLLASYLIEGHPDKLPILLTAIGRNENPTKAFERVLGESLPNLEERLRRWVLERSQIKESKRNK